MDEFTFIQDDLAIDLFVSPLITRTNKWFEQKRQNNPNGRNSLISDNDLCELFQVSHDTTKIWRDNKEIPYIIISFHPYYYYDSVMTFLLNTKNLLDKYKENALRYTPFNYYIGPEQSDDSIYLSKKDEHNRREDVEIKYINNQKLLQLLNISPRTAQKLRSKGMLPYSKLLGRVYYKIDDVNHMLDSFSNKPIFSLYN